MFFNQPTYVLCVLLGCTEAITGLFATIIGDKNGRKCSLGTNLCNDRSQTNCYLCNKCCNKYNNSKVKIPLLTNYSLDLEVDKIIAS